jgi:hypothetical protein
VTVPRRPVTLADTLDGAYQAVLGKLQLVRRHAADASSKAYRLRQQVAAIEAADDHARHDELARLRRELAEATEAETNVAAQSQRLQLHVDAFRLRKETLKASYLATETEQQAQQMLDDARTWAGPAGAPDQDARPGAVEVGQPAEAPEEGAGGAEAVPEGAGGAEAVPEGAGDAAAAESAPVPAANRSAAAGSDASATTAGPSTDLAAIAAAAEAEIAQMQSELDRELDLVLPAESIAIGLGHQPPPQVLELRPGAPGDDGIRVLFGVEPAGTALLISVLEGGEALRDHYDEAVQLSADVLLEVQAGEAPEAAAHTFATPDEFLGEFFPGDAERVSDGAADLVGRNRGRTLAAERSRLGLTQAQVAERMGTTRDQVEVIEQAGPGGTDIVTLAGFIKALGGRLEIIADFGSERVPLRAPTDPPS